MIPPPTSNLVGTAPVRLRLLISEMGLVMELATALRITALWEVTMLRFLSAVAVTLVLCAPA